MSGLAKYCLKAGKNVSGSDIRASDVTEELEKAGVKIYIGHCSENINNAQLVIYTSAVRETNPELAEAKRLGITVKKRSELLGEIIRSFGNSVAVSGCHGKTTTTAMIARIFEEAEKDPVVFLGGIDFLNGNFRDGNGDFGICEACEYKKNFLDIKPTVAVILNIDDDHLDSYGNLDNVKKAFSDFARGRLAVVNADDSACNDIDFKTAITFGINNQATYMAKNLIKTDKGYSFDAYGRGELLGNVSLKVKGLFNVYNALAAISVADSFFIDFCYIKLALEGFNGVERRMERLGKIYNVDCFADYAHHPKEISATLKDFSDGGKFAVIFQPHTYSRTRTLMGEFVDCLKNFSRVVIYKTYSAREDFDMQGSAYALFSNLVKSNSEIKEVSVIPDVGSDKDAENSEQFVPETYCSDKFASNNFYADVNSDKKLFYSESPESLIKIIKSMSEEVDRVIFVGAGDIYEIAKSLVTNYKTDSDQ